jgi:RimJ/RimL family protein N-acetyltransferase
MRVSVGRRHPRVELAGGLELRQWRQDDAAALLLAQRDALVARYAAFLLADTRDALATVQRYAAAWSDGDGVAWAIGSHGGELLGSLRFALHDAGLGCGSVGYWLSPHARGRGVASDALRLGSRLVFERLGWHRIELSHAVENERSCAVGRRAGYRSEGTLRDGMRYPVDGRWSDEHLHARLVTDPEPREF